MKVIRDSEYSVKKSEGRYFYQGFTSLFFFQDQEVAMRLVSLQMIGSVARIDIFSLKWRYYGPKRDILGYWGTHILFIILLYNIKG